MARMTPRTPGRWYSRLAREAVWLPPLPVAAAGLALALLNAWALVWGLIEIWIAGWAETDWDILIAGAERAAAGLSPYQDTLFRWSPIAAWLLVPVVSLPFWAWLVAHFGGAAAIGDIRLSALILLSWPFWQDLSNGNIMIFTLLAAAWTIRGSTAGGWAFGALAVLIPRPLMLPIVLWQLAVRPEWRLRWGALFVVHLALVALTGHASEWLAVLLTSGADIGNPYNLGPSAWIGWIWLPLGLVLGLWLTLRGRLGLASLAVAPYWFPYYLLLPFLELIPRSERGSHRARDDGTIQGDPASH